MDETQPLLAAHNERIDEGANSILDKNVIDFDHDDDPDNPMNWSKTYKWSIVALLAFTAFTVTFGCISVVPIADHIVADLDGGHIDRSASVLLVTIWELGEAAGPLLIAPLSEEFGRYPVINIASIGFISATVLAALCQTPSLFIAARALTGLFVTANVLNPAIVGDIFVSEQRGSAMSVIMITPLIGGAVGPAIAGALSESLGWRSVLWMAAVLASVCEIFFLTCFRETYKVAILRKKAARLRKETANPLLKTKFDVIEGPPLKKVARSVMRPFVVFYGSGVLQALSIVGSLVFTFFYILSTTFPEILQDVYGLSPTVTGLAFLSFSTGSLISVATCNIALDKIYVRLRDKHKGLGQPEYRLPLAIGGVLILPIFVALYGWIAELHLRLPLLLLSVGGIGSTLLLGYLPLTTYVVDATGLHSATALTALIVIRCLMGTFLPLVVGPLVVRFGYGLAFTVLAGILLSSAPLLVFLYTYGSRWRQKSIYTKVE